MSVTNYMILLSTTEDISDLLVVLICFYFAVLFAPSVVIMFLSVSSCASFSLLNLNVFVDERMIQTQRRTKESARVPGSAYTGVRVCICN